MTLVDLDIVNPYFRARSSAACSKAGVHLVAPVFGGRDEPRRAESHGRHHTRARGCGWRASRHRRFGWRRRGRYGAGRFSRVVQAHSHAMLYVLNRHRNLMADPVEAVQNLREIEAATHLHATGLVDNAHLKDETGPRSSCVTTTDMPRRFPSYPVYLSWQRPSPKACVGDTEQWLFTVRNMPRWSIPYVYMSRTRGNDRSRERRFHMAKNDR